LFKKRISEAASPEASRHWNRVEFQIGGSLYLKQFLERPFSLKIDIFDKNGSPNGHKMKTLGNYFSEKVQNRKSMFGLRRRGRIAYEPILWSAQGDPKIEEKK